MAFDFWALANDTSFQNEAIAEVEGRSFKNFEEDGEYEVTITNAEQKLTRAGDPQISLRLKATTGESGFWNLLVGHSGGTSTAARIAQQQLALIVKAAGRQVRDPSQLNGVSITVYVTIKEGGDGVARPNFRFVGKGSQAPVAAPVARPVAPKVVKPAPAMQEEPAADIDDDDIPF